MTGQGRSPHLRKWHALSSDGHARKPYMHKHILEVEVVGEQTGNMQQRMVQTERALAIHNPGNHNHHCGASSPSSHGCVACARTSSINTMLKIITKKGGKRREVKEAEKSFSRVLDAASIPNYGRGHGETWYDPTTGIPMLQSPIFPAPVHWMKTKAVVAMVRSRPSKRNEENEVKRTGKRKTG